MWRRRCFWRASLSVAFLGWCLWGHPERLEEHTLLGALCSLMLDMDHPCAIGSWSTLIAWCVSTAAKAKLVTWSWETWPTLGPYVDTSLSWTYTHWACDWTVHDLTRDLLTPFHQKFNPLHHLQLQRWKSWRSCHWSSRLVHPCWICLLRALWSHFCLDWL